MLGCLLPQHLLTYLLDSLKVNEKRKGMLLPPAHWRVIVPRRHSPLVGGARCAGWTRALVGLLPDAAGCRPVPLTADVGKHGGELPADAA